MTAAVEAKVAAAKPEAARARGLVWLPVQTKGFAEVVAKDNLERQAQLGHFCEGFEVYFPQQLSENAKTRKLQTRPFFPRILFVRADLRLASWKRIWSTRGVQGIMGSSAERPFCVADWVIERVRDQEDAGFIRMGLEVDQEALQAHAASFKDGEKVRLSGSPLEAVFQSLDGEKRASILVSLFGRDSRVLVDLKKLRSTSGN